MLIWTARVSKKTKAVVAVILAGILAAAVLLLVGRSGGGQDAAAWQLTGNADRIAYLESMGWQVEEEPVETLQFLLPEKLEEPYLTYNELQDSQGFDLSACCGKQVARYTYTVTNYPGRPEGVQANLYVCVPARPLPPRLPFGAPAQLTSLLPQRRPHRPYPHTYSSGSCGLSG